MQRYIYCESENVPADVSRIASESHLPVRSDLPEYSHIVHRGSSHCVILVPEVQECFAAEKRHPMIGHTVHVTDEFNGAAGMECVYVDPMGVARDASCIRREDFHAVFYSPLGSTGTWKYSVTVESDGPKENIFSGEVEVTNDFPVR